MKKIVSIIILSLVINIFPVGTYRGMFLRAAFSDVRNYRYNEAISYLVSNNIVQGYSDGTYRPEQNVTRAEMMKIILKDSIDGQTRSGCFGDVNDEWFAEFICYGKERGVVDGYADGRFKPNQNVNFAEAMKIAFNGLQITDVPETGGEWYEKYEEFAENNLIFRKYLYSPSDLVTRGEMAELVYRSNQYNNGEIRKNAEDKISFGCGQNPPSQIPTTVQVRGEIRDYITVLPRNYDKNKAYPIVFAFHGRTNSNTQVRGYYKVEEASNGQAFVVYPNGRVGSTRWRANGDSNQEIRGFDFFDELMVKFSNEYCLDLDRVYAVGHSLGAWITNSLACTRGNVIRAIGTVGGGTTINECAGPVNVIIMHNPEDELATFSSGEIARDQYIRQNSCNADSSINYNNTPGILNCTEYQSCTPDGQTIWCPHSDSTAWNGKRYTHTWPDDAGKEIWEFFEKFK